MRFVQSTILATLLLSAAMLQAQTLARRGWAGSGMTVAPWWQSAVLYQVDPVSFQDSKGDGFGDLHGIASRLDYLQSLGVDALVLAPLQSGPAAGRANAGQPFDPAYGTPDDLDQLVADASRHKIRVLADLPLSAMRPAQESVNVARFWLSRGVAGLRLTLDAADPPSTAQQAERVRELKRLAATYAGERVLFWDVTTPIAAAISTQEAVQMTLNASLELIPQLDAGSIRHALATLPAPRAGRTIVLATDAGDRPRSFDRYGEGAHNEEQAKLLATALLAAPGAPLLYFGQEIGMATTPSPAAVDKSSRMTAGAPTPMQWGDAIGFTAGVPWMDMGRNTATANVAMEQIDRYSLLNWCRRLTALRHANAVLREGSLELLQLSNPSVAAWVRRTKAGSPVLVICNFSDRPVALSIAAELHRLAVPAGTGVMHTLATSDAPAAAGTVEHPDPGSDAPVSVNAISLPAFGVYIGELRGQSGLETQPQPARSRRSR